MALRFIAIDRWGNQLGTITDVLVAEWTEELNGEDTVVLETVYPLAKGNRVVWCDMTGAWHEHTVAAITQIHEDGEVIYAATCENSISELYGDYIDDKRPENATASYALGVALVPTRWTVGAATVTGSNSTNFYRESCREAVQKVQEVWGGELSTTITVSGTEVTARKVNLTRRGTSNGRRFTYGRDMTGIKRVFEADDVVTALYGYGKGEEVKGGNGRGINFASINGGKEYVEDTAALAVWGRPNGRGGKAHVFGKVEFSDCEDKAELLKLTKAEHDKRKVPRVSYEASVQVFAAYGYDFADVGIGDDVALLDQGFTPEIRVGGRVVKIVRDLLDDGKVSDICIGNIIENAADLIAGQYADLQKLNNRATSWDVAAYTPSAYINQIMNGLNAEFDAGASYIYQSPEQGIIIGSVPLDPASGKPTRTPASAIQLKGGGFRIANAVNADGSWNWRTFGTGDGFTADEIVAGVIKGGSSHWNLETGEFNIVDGRIEITDSKGNKTTLDTTNGFQLVDENGRIIAGTEVVGGKSTFFADKVGRGDSYVTIGTGSDGYGGMEYVQNGTPSLKATPVAASGSRVGLNLGSNGLQFLAAITGGGTKGTVIRPPSSGYIYDTWSDRNRIVITPTQFSAGVGSYAGITIGTDIVTVMKDATHYFQMSGSNWFFRDGNQGFGWWNGAFTELLTWS